MEKYNIKIYHLGEIIYEYKSKNKDIKTISKRITSLINRDNSVSSKLNVKTCNVCGESYAKVMDVELEYTINDKLINVCIKYCQYKKYFEYESLYCGKCLSKQLNPNSFEYISKVCDITLDIAKEILHKRNKSPFYLCNHKDEDSYKKSQTRDEEWYISKYGEIGVEKYKSMCDKSRERMLSMDNKLKDSMSIIFHKKKYGDDYLYYYEKRKESVRLTLSDFIKRHGEVQGHILYEEKRRKSAYTMSEKYYIDKYGICDGPKKWTEIRSKFSVNIDKFIHKYGVDEGQKLYKKWLCTSQGNGKSYSMECVNFFKEIELEFPQYSFMYGDNERFIYKQNYYRNQSIFFYDCYIKELNLLIEYDTPHYHPNEDIIDYDLCLKSPIYHSYEKEKDYAKEKLAKENNYGFYRCFIINKNYKQIEQTKLINYIKKYEYRGEFFISN